MLQQQLHERLRRTIQAFSPTVHYAHWAHQFSWAVPIQIRANGITTSDQLKIAVSSGP